MNKNIPQSWKDIPKIQQKSCYWLAVPNNKDSILDGMEYEIVYVYFDGKWSVLRCGQLAGEPLEAFQFIIPIIIEEGEIEREFNKS